MNYTHTTTHKILFICIFALNLKSKDCCKMWLVLVKHQEPDAGTAATATNAWHTTTIYCWCI